MVIILQTMLQMITQNIPMFCFLQVDSSLKNRVRRTGVVDGSVAFEGASPSLCFFLYDLLLG